MGKRTTDEDFLRLFKELGSPVEVARALGIGERAVYFRRNSIEKKLGVRLDSHRGAGTEDYLQRITMTAKGTVVVFSDCHYWPGQPPTIAHRALVHVINEIKPTLVIGNGDLFDGARISRFPRNGWEELPRIADELSEAVDRLDEIRHAAPNAQFVRTVGNHCIRFDKYLAGNASEMEGVPGSKLTDHLPAWTECMSVWLNGHTMVKHRYHGGVHAGHNNTLKAGSSIVTGHTHILKVDPWNDYNGRRWGVQTGAIADVEFGPQFHYTEDNPKPWCSGFGVLTFDDDGYLMPPELCEVIRGRAIFRGKVVPV